MKNIKHYDLIIGGQKIQTDKKDYFFNLGEVRKNPGKLIALKLREKPLIIRLIINLFARFIKTRNHDFRYAVNYIKKHGYPKYTDEELSKAIYATYSIGSLKENRAAIRSAVESFEEFKNIPLDKRISIVETFREKLLRNKNRLEEISKILYMPHVFKRVFDNLMHNALNQNSLNHHRQHLSPIQMTESSFIQKKPYGVFGIVIPYNNAFVSGLLPVISSIVSGNCCVVRLNRYPVVLIESIEILHQALEEHGCSKGIVNIISGPGKDIINEWINNADIKGIVFYGESGLGLDIGGKAIKKAKKIILELAGSDPVLVWKDADIGRVVEKIVEGRFFASGQVCFSIKRAYVHEEIYDDFIKKTIEHVTRLQFATSLTGSNDILDQIMVGSPKALMILKEILQDAVGKGAKILTGGYSVNYLGEEDSIGLFFQPSVVSDVDHTMDIMNKEVFGPILPVMKIREINETINMINSSLYGLRASLWAKDINIIEKFLSEINTGNVIINEHNGYFDDFSAHLGGTKLSGITGAKYFHQEMCYSQYVHVCRFS